MATASQSCVSNFPWRTWKFLSLPTLSNLNMNSKTKPWESPLAIHSKTRSNLFAQVEKQVIEKGEKKTLYTARFLYCLHDPRKPIDFYWWLKKLTSQSGRSREEKSRWWETADRIPCRLVDWSEETRNCKTNPSVFNLSSLPSDKSCFVFLESHQRISQMLA